MASVPLGTTWQDLGAGPLAVQVLCGTVVVQCSDKRPAADDSSGTIVTAVVGADPARLGGTGEWWAKGLVTGTAILVASAVAAVPVAPAAGAVTGHSDEGGAIAGADLEASVIVVLAPDGTLRPASSSDPDQFGLVTGFTLFAAPRGAAVAITRRETVTNSRWALRPGPVFVGEGGAPTDVEPPRGFVQVAGFAVSATAVVVDFGAPTLL